MLAQRRSRYWDIEIRLKVFLPIGKDSDNKTATAPAYERDRRPGIT